MRLPVPLREYRERVKRCQTAMKKEGFDGIIAISRSPDRPGHVRYLCNYYNPVSYNPSTYASLGLGYSAMLIPFIGEPTLIVGGFPPEETDQKVAVHDVAVYPFMSNLASAISEVVKEKGLQNATIGIAGLDVLSAQIYLEIVNGSPSLRFSNANSVLEELRMVKSENEIRLLRTAAKLADRTIEWGMERIEEGKRECAVAGDIARFLLENKTERILWIDVKSGPRLKYPITWPMASNRKLKQGDLVFFDIGATSETGYAFDVSRTAVIGSATPKQKELLSLTYDMSREVVKASKPGVRANELVTLAREYVRREGMIRKLRIKPHIESISYAGHGLGFEVEPPQLTLEHTDELKENMVLALEPGVEVPKVGSAVFEDNIVVTDRGGQLLTRYLRKM